MAKTIDEINEKIKEGKAVVVTAEEIIDLVKQKGTQKAAQEVDVVTTGTFGPMCSSGAYFNIGHAKPRIKLGGGRIYLNDVLAYAGFAAADVLIGANALPDDDPRNKIHPGEFNYGGGHVIEELVAGKDIRLSATAYGTDCYPRKKLETWINIKDLNEAVLFNPRNAYQNYNVAANASDKTAVIGDLKQMNPRWLMGTSMLGYGCTITVGIGVPIPILSEEILNHTTVTDDEIFAAIIDYANDYPNLKPDILDEVSYAQLKSGMITIQGKEVPTASLSSYPRAVEIANLLKEWILSGKFQLTEPVASLPGVESDITFKPLKERPIED